ncbi:hypothetical protein CF326_g8748, partial [Tilletia indica]
MFRKQSEHGALLSGRFFPSSLPDGTPPFAEKVTLGSGAIGKPIIEECLAAKLPLTILIRDESKPEPQAYKARDAVLKAHKEKLPNDLAKAAKKAGVKVYVPSEVGLDYVNPRTAPFPGLVQAKLDHHKFVEELGLPWVAFANGAFGDWLFHPGFGYDFKNKTAV